MRRGVVLVAVACAEKHAWTRLACEMEETSGPVSDCGCAFEEVDDATAAYFGPLLRNVTQRTFFKYFKVALDRPCPFWSTEGQCARRECAIDECPSSELPAPWLDEDEQRRAWATEKSSECTSWLQGWSESGGEEVWIDQGEQDDMVYVDLTKNPEKFTGYDGEEATRIWRALYDENCFTTDEIRPKETFLNAYRVAKTSECLERRVFYRLISGLQASISTHIARSDFDDWRQIVRAAAKDRKFSALLAVLLEDEQRLKNDAVFVARVGAHAERVHNLYFAYLFVLRAVSRAKDELLAFDYDTGDPVDDQRTRDLVAALVGGDRAGDDETRRCAERAVAAFDESVLFKPPDDPRMTDLERALARESVEELRAEFVAKYRNISRIMDCVLCERCRLWGKLQILGIGTALKILLMDGDEAGLGVLQRNEVVALVNTLAQLAKSVDSVRDWHRRDLKRAKAKLALAALAALLALLLALASALLARLLVRRARAICRCLLGLSPGKQEA